MFRRHLLGTVFIVLSQYQALRAEFEKLDNHGPLCRWLHIMEEYEFEIRHEDSDQKSLGDYLSHFVSSDQSKDEEKKIGRVLRKGPRELSY